MSDPAQFDEYQQVRYEKLLALREQGVDPFPPRSSRTHRSDEAIAVLERHEAAHGDDAEATRPAATVAGRVVAIRLMGKAAFLQIEDGAGRFQLYLRRDTLGAERYNELKKLLDYGDIIEAEGTLFRTRTSEPTLEAASVTMLAKALNQPPEKWHGLTDVQRRYRERYVDLFSNPEVREIFRTRARITRLIRDYMDSLGYVEVETPILQPLYGGAAARPFVTHHNWAHRDLYLRIADELYLKRLIVGGFERVYEIGKDFRNEGVSFKHNPEFTMVEAYQAYADYTDMMALIEGCWQYLAEHLLDGTTLTYGEHEIDLSLPWRRMTMRDSLLEYGGIDIEEATTLDALRAAIEERALEIDRKPTWGTQVDELFSELVEPRLIQPTLIVDYPREISPLAKPKPDNPRLVERFELFVAGFELANAFTELNDPLDQLERFRQQQREAASGDEEAHPIDEDYVNALMYGMPPTGGIGWGLDRMVMVLTNQRSIREVILFPLLRESQEDD